MTKESIKLAIKSQIASEGTIDRLKWSPSPVMDSINRKTDIIALNAFFRSGIAGSLTPIATKNDIELRKIVSEKTPST